MTRGRTATHRGSGPLPARFGCEPRRWQRIDYIQPPKQIRRAETAGADKRAHASRRSDASQRERPADVFLLTLPWRGVPGPRTGRAGAMGGLRNGGWGSFGQQALHAHRVEGLAPPGAVAGPVELIGDGAQGWPWLKVWSKG